MTDAMVLAAGPIFFLTHDTIVASSRLAEATRYSQKWQQCSHAWQQFGQVWQPCSQKCSHTRSPSTSASARAQRRREHDHQAQPLLVSFSSLRAHPSSLSPTLPPSQTLHSQQGKGTGRYPPPYSWASPLTNHLSVGKPFTPNFSPMSFSASGEDATRGGSERVRFVKHKSHRSTGQGKTRTSKQLCVRACVMWQ